MNSKGVQVVCIDTLEGFRALETEWDSLLAQSKNTNVFLTWEWLFAWWQIFGGKNRLWLLTVKDNGELIGIAPLMISVYRKGFFRLRVLRSIGTPQSDMGGLIANRKEVAAIAVSDYLKKHEREWDIFEMNVLPADVFESNFFPKIFAAKEYFLITNDDSHFYLPLKGTWESYFRGLSKNLRRNLKRRLKRAKELGEVRYQRYAGENLQWAHFLKIFEINRSGNFPAVYQAEKNRNFLKKIYELMRKKQWLQVEILYVGEEAVAFQCGFLFGKKYQDWRGGYNKKYETLGTGKLLMMFSLENFYRMGVEAVDFLRGTYAYKADWKPQMRRFVDLRVFRKKSKEALAVYFWLKYLKPRLRAKKNG
jgi:CelD/BcsL family acetyltransferase involved in cellulose biosynthesis